MQKKTDGTTLDSGPVDDSKTVETLEENDTGDLDTKPNTGQNAEPNTGTTKKALAEKEIGGPKGLEPTRYGDWERNGRCYDF